MVAGVDIVAVVDSARNVRPGDVVTLHISLDKIPWGSETRIRSCGEAVVFVDEPTEQVPSTNSVRTDRDRDQGFGQR